MHRNKDLGHSIPRIGGFQVSRKVRTPEDSRPAHLSRLVRRGSPPSKGPTPPSLPIMPVRYVSEDGVGW